ncbi:MAG: sigma-54-dependent transcriptional regulator, partial [Candidatus Angelobacter sp.]
MSSAMRFLSHPNAVPLKAPCVLVADSEPLVRHRCKQIAEELGCRVFLAEDAASTLRRLTTNSVNLVLLDSLLAQGNGTDLLSRIRAQQPEAQVVIMSRQLQRATEAAALKNGACDFLRKPLQILELKKLFRKLSRQASGSLEPYNTLEQPIRGSDSGRMVGESPEMKKLERMIPNIAFSKHPVLISGEKGTGKERLARAIHEAASLHEDSFVVVDCSTSPAALETELFGDGTANGLKAPSVQLARRGTVFLDAVTQMPLTTQGKLLRALQEKQIRVAGSSKPVLVEAQIIAATQHDLDAAVRQGIFR